MSGKDPLNEWLEQSEIDYYSHPVDSLMIGAHTFRMPHVVGPALRPAIYDFALLGGPLTLRRYLINAKEVPVTPGEVQGRSGDFSGGSGCECRAIG
jgi:hypothetical protein